jgi:uncharacterized protein YcfJ
MTQLLRSTAALAALLVCGTAAAQVTLYEREGFRGRTFAVDRQVDDMSRAGFNDRTSSIVVERGTWLVCEDARFEGRCAELRPGRYESLRNAGLDGRISSIRPVAAAVQGGNAGQITFYEGEGFRGRAFNADRRVDDFSRTGFNDRASSIVVDRGRWEVCEHANFQGRCTVLRKGSYDSLRDMGLENQISSVRPVERNRRGSNEAAPQLATPNYAWRQRPDERTYDAQVTSVRAVVGPPNQRCWMERQQVSQPSAGHNIGGAVIGGLIGGILGHQVGGGSGKQIATAGGAVAGAVVGSQVGRNNNAELGQDVQRCENVASTTPEYWDVTYNHWGTDHRVQMSAPPGNTIAVNASCEPRQ